MINCPNKLNCSLITTDTNPVTHVAEVAINKLFKYDVGLALLQIGKLNKTEPIKITAKKLSAICLVGRIV